MLTPDLQRYLSPDEYAQLGYILKEDIVFDAGSYSSFHLDPNPYDWSYRADTKEEFLIDYATLFFKMGAAYATGGLSTGTHAGAVTAMVSAAWTTMSRLVFD